MKKILLMIALGALTGVAIGQENSAEMGKMALQVNANAGVEISADELKAYEGNYELMPGFNLKFFIKKGKLISQATGQEEHVLIAHGEHVFKPTTFAASITFIADENGNFNEMILKQSGQEMRAPKVE